MTATQTPCLSEADRFFGTTTVPDPPENPPGRHRYWGDAVTEVVGELRRLRSSREGMVTHAVFAILDLEKHKLRHGRPISGTHVPYLGDLDEDRARPLPRHREGVGFPAEPPTTRGSAGASHSQKPNTLSMSEEGGSRRLPGEVSSPRSRNNRDLHLHRHPG